MIHLLEGVKFGNGGVDDPKRFYLYIRGSAKIGIYTNSKRIEYIRGDIHVD
jgi:hypothetical protein